MAIESRLLNESEDVLARTLRIKHARGSLETPTYAVSVAEIDRELISEDSLQGIVEVPLLFKPEQLENMSRDASLQQRFEYRVNSYIRRISSDQLTVAVPILEGRQDLSLKYSVATYSTYIAELVHNPRMDIVCTPVFHRVPEQLIKVFVEEFLHAMSAYDVHVALTIPYASRDARDELVKTYLEWSNRSNRMLLNFLCADYNGSNPISKYVLHNYVLGYVRTLQEEIGVPVAVYGVNVKYSRVAKKYYELPARDLVAYYAQLDIFGGNHKRRPLPREVAERSRDETTLSKQKLLNRERYTYISIDKMMEDPKLMVDEVKIVEALVAEGYQAKYIERIVNRLNIKSILAETNTLRSIFSGKGWQTYEKPLQYLMSKEAIRIDETILNRLKSFTKLLRKTRKLDEYLK